MVITIIMMVTCKAAGLSMITSAACLRARLALCSPSAAITCTGGVIIMMTKIIVMTIIILCSHSAATTLMEGRLATLSLATKIIAAITAILVLHHLHHYHHYHHHYHHHH